MKKIIVVVFLHLLLTQVVFSQTKVKFILNDLANISEKKVGIRGNTYPLDWSKSLQLLEVDEKYIIEIEFPINTSEIEFKFVLFDDDRNPTWETSRNRSEILGAKNELISIHQWNVEQVIDISLLPLIQPEQLQSDYKLIEQMVLEVHPGTYRYNDESSIIKELKELREKFQKPMSPGEAYLTMAKLTAAIQCDHTKPGFNNQTKIINSVIHGQPDKLPFTFKWFEKRMILIYDATSANLLNRGTEVLSINGVPVSQIRETMLPYISADGATDNNRIRKMEVDGYDFRYNSFDVFYPLLFPIDSNKVELEIITKGIDLSSNIEVNTVTREGRAEVLINRYTEFPSSRDDLWSFKITEDNIGILEANSFGLMGWKALSIDYKAFLEKAFKSLEEKKTQSLVIDIRDNTGGNDEMAVELFSYLDINESITREAYREGRTRYLEFPEPLKNNVQTWGEDPWFFNLNTDEQDGEYYIFKENPDNKSYLKQSENVFKGEIYLLTSSNNTSLAYYTALNFRRQGLGKIIGQETGGNMKGINGGQILFLKLPNSGIEIDFSIMGGFVYGDQLNNGVIPDIEVLPTLNQIKNGDDAELEVALQIIRAK